MKRIFGIIMLILFAVQFSGCSAAMALKQPQKRNLQVLNAGTSRDNVVTYLGAPISSETENGKRVEIYQFTQGYSGAVKAARATWHVIADVATIFIWELIGMPMEAIVDGNKMTIKVTYDANDRLEDFVYLQQPV